MEDRDRQLRVIEALLFSAKTPLSAQIIAEHTPELKDVAALLADLAAHYSERGVNLINVAGGWTFRTAPDLAPFLRREAEVQRKLSRAALETLAIVAYHQPVTRIEIEQIRGVTVSKGTLDILFDVGWIAPRGRRRTPGRPVTRIGIRCVRPARPAYPTPRAKPHNAARRDGRRRPLPSRADLGSSAPPAAPGHASRRRPAPHRAVNHGHGHPAGCAWLPGRRVR